jgi:hypothetical protein
MQCIVRAVASVFHDQVSEAKRSGTLNARAHRPNLERQRRTMIPSSTAPTSDARPA